VKQNFSQELRRQKCFIISVSFLCPQSVLYLCGGPHMWNKLFYLLHWIKHNVTWLSSRWWLAACDWLMSWLR